MNSWKSQDNNMIGFLMFSVFFVFLVFVTITSRNKTIMELKSLEYEEWMEKRGYIKIEIEFLCNEIACEGIDIVTTNKLSCYIQSGVYNFVVKKNVFSDIEVYPIKPSVQLKEDVRKTKSMILNTSCFKTVTLL